MHSGAITKNEAGVGGGVFVWNGCHFEMTGGEISSNKAKDPDKTDDSDGPLRAHEGGGIFTDAKDTKITMKQRLLPTGVAVAFISTTMAP